MFSLKENIVDQDRPKYTMLKPLSETAVLHNSDPPTPT